MDDKHLVHPVIPEACPVASLRQLRVSALLSRSAAAKRNPGQMARRRIHRRTPGLINGLITSRQHGKIYSRHGHCCWLRNCGWLRRVRRKKFELFKPPRIPMMSVVSKGEIYSLAIQRRWGEKKLRVLEELLRKLPVVDINDEQIIHRYPEIDAYSLSKIRCGLSPKV
jgi:hypothetical protein